MTLGPKEGLALLNGTQFSTAYALAGLFETEAVFRSALVTGALATDAARGSDARRSIPGFTPSDRHGGQIRVAAAALSVAHDRQRYPVTPTSRTTTACRTRTASAASHR